MSSAAQSCFFWETLALNNEGVTFLQQGQTESAIARFTHAMYLAQKYDIASYDDDEEDSLFWDDDEDEDDPPCMVTGATIGDSLSLPSMHGTPTSRTFYVYNRAFLFTGHGAGGDAKHVSSLVSTVLLYNTGLAYHLLANSSSSSSGNAHSDDDNVKNVHAALRCYKCGLNIIRNTGTPSREPLFLLALAFLNNLAHAFAHNNNGNATMDENARTCQDMLDALLESFVPDTLSAEDADFFYFGKFFRTHATVVITAAAAA